MFTSLLAIARIAFIESVRQPIYPAMLLLAGILQVFNTWSTAFSMEYTTSSEVVKDNKLLLDIGLAGVFVFGMLLAAFTATAVLSREIEDKTVLTVVSKPVSRPIVILGKYLGVAAALFIAVWVMSLSLMIGLRHGVMSTAADTLDMPVIVFTGSAVGITLLFSAWSNFFYGWSFPQTLSLTLAATLSVAYAGLVFVGPEWRPQPVYQIQWERDQAWLTTTQYMNRYDAPPQRDYDPNSPVGRVSGKRVFYPTLLPQVTLACIGTLMGILVLSAVATAASTRLGQVMTIVVCSGVFVGGLLSNYMLGSMAYNNSPVARTQSAHPIKSSDSAFTRDGAEYHIGLQSPLLQPLKPGDPIYYGTSPNGFLLAVGGSPQAVSVTQTEEQSITVSRTGDGRVSRPPQQGDYIFDSPTKINPLAAGIHAVIPNMQHYWLSDAISQNNPIPPAHMVRLGVYALLQIVAFLALGIVLFQERDVG